MAHYHSGLPPLDLEPFDPTPLWAATNSPSREKERARDRSRRLVAWMAAGVTAAVGLAAAAFVLLG
jgi:hypothetical protein